MSGGPGVRVSESRKLLSRIGSQGLAPVAESNMSRSHYAIIGRPAVNRLAKAAHLAAYNNKNLIIIIIMQRGDVCVLLRVSSSLDPSNE